MNFKIWPILRFLMLSCRATLCTQVFVGGIELKSKPKTHRPFAPMPSNRFMSWCVLRKINGLKSDVHIAQADEGHGGNIHLSASSKLKIDAYVTIDSPEMNWDEFLVVLPGCFVEASLSDRQ